MLKPYEDTSPYVECYGEYHTPDHVEWSPWSEGTGPHDDQRYCPHCFPERSEGDGQTWRRDSHGFLIGGERRECSDERGNSHVDPEMWGNE